MKYIFLIVVLLLNACSVMPKVVENRDRSCQLFTKELALQPFHRSGFHCSNSHECAVVMAIELAGLAVVGSIYLIGNSIHWLEKKGRCSNKKIETELNAYQDSINKHPVQAKKISSHE